MARCRRLLLWASVLTVAMLALVGRVSATPTDSPASFRAVASSEGIRTTVSARGAPLSDRVLDSASPLAQVELDSARGTTALASALYPGDLVVTAPGLVAGFTGGDASGVVPEYPLIAIAGSTTQPESRADGPGTSMQASTDSRRATAVVTTGTGATDSGVRSSIVTDAEALIDDNGEVRAAGSTDVNGITIGPLSIARVLSHAQATLGTDGDLTRTSSFEITGISVAGIAAKLTPDGLVVADTTTPLASDALQPILDDSGLDVDVIQEERTDDGVVSGGLTITRSQELPGAVTPATVTHTFGRVAVHLSTTALPASVAAHAPSAAEPPAAVGQAQPPARGASSTGQSTSAQPPTPLADPDASAEATTPVPARFATDLFDMTTFYLVLVAAAAAGGTILELLRHLGVRLTWN